MLVINNFHTVAIDYHVPGLKCVYVQVIEHLITNTNSSNLNLENYIPSLPYHKRDKTKGVST